MRSTSKMVRALGAVSALALLATACGGDTEGEGAETQEPADGGETTDGEGEDVAGGEFSVYICEPQHLIPTNTNETCGSEVLNSLFSALVTYDAETSDPVWGDEAPRAVAQSIESEDNVNWTVTLKDGWTFHNGEPVTAQSFVDAWNYGAYGPNAQGNSYFFANIAGSEDLVAEEEGAEPVAERLTGLEVVDDTTFTVELTEPFSQFPLTLGYTAFYPMPQAAFEDPAAYEEAPIGNGPYMMDGSWNHDQNINVVTYADYAGEPGNADAIEYRIYAEINTAYTDLIAGNLDVMDTIPPEQLASAKDEFGDRYIQRESSSYTYLGLPSYNEQLANDDIGKALSMAIDRQAIIDAIFNGAFTPAASVVSPVVAGSREDACGEGCQYDPEAARELFESAGGVDLPLTMWFNSGAGHEEWIEAVANQWSQNLGIPIDQIQFESLQFADYLDRLDNQEVDGPFRLGWVMDYPSPQNYLEPMHATGGSTNLDGYSNEQVDALIQQGNAAGSIEEGIEFYQQAEDLILADWHHIPLWFGQVNAGHSENVSNVAVDAFTQIRVADITVSNG
jgi:oligopeptide transport system substrate-binding protein